MIKVHPNTKITGKYVVEWRWKNAYSDAKTMQYRGVLSEK